jgi:hypothetical protein
MALTIQDLPQNDDLDRQAMHQIAGGARTSVRPAAGGARTGVRPLKADGPAPRGGRIVDYPPGFGSEAPVPAKDSSKAG